MARPPRLPERAAYRVQDQRDATRTTARRRGRPRRAHRGVVVIQAEVGAELPESKMTRLVLFAGEEGA